MGLDTTHNCWHGPYSAFHRFRTHLARAAGGDYVIPEPCGAEVDIVGIEETDPLYVLLNHSDCDGVIESKDCEALANRLEELAPRLPDFRGCRDASLSEAALQFAAGLRRAAEAGEDVEFH